MTLPPGGEAAVAAFSADATGEDLATPGVGVAVLSSGRVEDVRGFGRLAADRDDPVGPGSLFHAASMSKLVCAVGVLRLVAQGRLGLDEPVDERLRSWRLLGSDGRPSREVSLRALLSHHGGIVDADDAFGPCGSGPVPTLLDVLDGATPLNPRPVVVAGPPGRRFSYSDGGYCVVEQLLADVTGTPFDVLMDELVLAPLSLERSRFGPGPDGPDVASGHERCGAVVPGRRPIYPYLAACGLWSTPGELAVVVGELHAALAGGGRLGLPGRLVEDLLRGQGPTPWAGLGAFVAGPPDDVRLMSLGWGVGFQCALRAWPRRGDAVVVMTNVDPGRPQEDALSGALVRAVGERRGWSRPAAV